MANDCANERMTSQKRKFILFATALILALAAILVFGGISLAKYTQSVQSEHAAAVGSFVPTITYDESWEVEDTLVAGSSDEPRKYPFAVKNDADGAPILVIVELTVEQVLPLQCELYQGTNPSPLDPYSIEGDTRTYKYLVESGEADFSLSVSWLEGERDERFNGLTNDVHMVVVCEQAQVGGAE